MSRDGSNCFLRDRGGDEEREGEGGRGEGEIVYCQVTG